MTPDTILCGDSLAIMKTWPDACVDLVFGSPPYAEKGERYQGSRRKWPTTDWVLWMSEFTKEAIRVSRGYVLWVANGAVRNGEYHPACEGLVWSLYSESIVCERPCIWHKNAPPNRRDWFGNDWEFVLAFKPEGASPYFDWEAIAKPPAYSNGGHFRQRSANGSRRRGGDYPKNKLARPRDVIRCLVGGGHMGHPLAHDNEAPFPESLAEKFILACCPPGGIVCDPFCGSGTTPAVAIKHGRHYVAMDIRQSQCDLAQRRLEDVRGSICSINESPLPASH